MHILSECTHSAGIPAKSSTEIIARGSSTQSEFTRELLVMLIDDVLNLEDGRRGVATTTYGDTFYTF